MDPKKVTYRKAESAAHKWRVLSNVVTDADQYQAGAFGLAQCQASGAGDCAVREQFCSGGT